MSLVPATVADVASAIVVTVKQLAPGDRILVAATAAGLVPLTGNIPDRWEAEAMFALVVRVGAAAQRDSVSRTRGYVVVDTDEGTLGALPHNAVVRLASQRAW